MFKKVEKSEFRGRICAGVTSERFERMDILRGQNAESIINKTENVNLFLRALTL